MKENSRNVLNKIMTVVVVLLAALCIILAVKVIGGKDTSIFGYQIYHIMTGSMEPTIPTGSTVITKRVDPYILEVGDVITFISRDEAIYGNANTHRIIGIDDSNGERRFITKGDANGTADSIEVPVGDVKGKVIFHANLRGFSMFFNFMRTGYGFLTVVCLPFIFILWQITMKLKREIKVYAEENARAEAAAELAKNKDDEEAKRLKEEEFERIKAQELQRLREEAEKAQKAEEAQKTQQQDQNQDQNKQ